MPSGGYLGMVPSWDLAKKGTFGNGTAQWYYREQIWALVERDANGHLRLEVRNGRGKPLTLAEMAHARKHLADGAEVVVVLIEPQQRPDVAVLVQLVANAPGAGLLAVPAR